MRGSSAGAFLLRLEEGGRALGSVRSRWLNKRCSVLLLVGPRPPTGDATTKAACPEVRYKAWSRRNHKIGSVGDKQKGCPSNSHCYNLDSHLKLIMEFSKFSRNGKGGNVSSAKYRQTNAFLFIWF